MHTSILVIADAGVGGRAKDRGRHEGGERKIGESRRGREEVEAETRRRKWKMKKKKEDGKREDKGKKEQKQKE